MKKIVLATAIISTISLFGSQLNLNKESVLDEVTMCGLQSKVVEINDVSLGLYYTYNKYNDLYQNISENEFDLGDAVSKYSKIFKSKIKESCSAINNKMFILNLNADLKKYDFTRQGFPINGMTADSEVGFRGDLAEAKLVFDNADNSKNFLPISKDKARSIMKKIKRSYDNRGLSLDLGVSERTILAKYYYIIDKIDTPIANLVAYTIPSNMSFDKIYDEIVHAKVLKVEYLNRYTNEVLHTQKY